MNLKAHEARARDDLIKKYCYLSYSRVMDRNRMACYRRGWRRPWDGPDGQDFEAWLEEQQLYFHLADNEALELPSVAGGSTTDPNMRLLAPEDDDLREEEEERQRVRKEVESRKKREESLEESKHKAEEEEDSDEEEEEGDDLFTLKNRFNWEGTEDMLQYHFLLFNAYKNLDEEDDDYSLSIQSLESEEELEEKDSL